MNQSSRNGMAMVVEEGSQDNAEDALRLVDALRAAATLGNGDRLNAIDLLDITKEDINVLRERDREGIIALGPELRRILVDEAHFLETAESLLDVFTEAASLQHADRKIRLDASYKPQDWKQTSCLLRMRDRMERGALTVERRVRNEINGQLKRCIQLRKTFGE